MNRETLQRSLVLASVNKLDHPTAEDVYADITLQYPNISRGTVYRNLNLLAQRNVIGRVMTYGSADHFDSESKRHFHAQCTCCGKIFDIRADYLTAFLDQIEEENGFIIEEYNLLFKGRCPECRKKGKING